MTTATESLTELEFRRSSPASLKKAASRGDAAAFQREITALHRRAAKRLAKALPNGEAAILWSAGAGESGQMDQTPGSLLSGNRKQRRQGRRAAIRALIDGDTRPRVVLTAVDTLIRDGSDLKPADFAALYCALSQLDEIVPEEPPADDRELSILKLICDGELPLILSLVLADLKGQSTRLKSACRTLKEGLHAGTDTDGMLHAELVAAADEWLAPQVRAAYWAGAFEEEWLKSGDVDRLAAKIRSCVVLLVQNGLVSNPPDDLRETGSAAEVFEYALKVVGIRDSSPFHSFVCANGRKRSKKKSAKNRRSRSLQTSNQSDWAESAVLRSGLQADSDVCVVNWDQPQASIHLGVLGTPLLSGTWSSEVLMNGESIGSVENWHCSCWFCDDEAAFAELEADPTDSVHVVRHVMLSLQDRLGVICESVTTTDPDVVVQLKSELPLAVNPLAVTNSITREIVLHADCVSARVIPAWLEDDRVRHTTGRCEKVGDVLRCESEGIGGATSPLLFDWHPERQAQEADWNRLTVTEDRQVVSGQLAAGFRVRVGRKQTLIYRSLRTGELPRAVLGLHTLNETVYGRVKKSGEVAPLVLVEGE